MWKKETWWNSLWTGYGKQVLRSPGLQANDPRSPNKIIFGTYVDIYDFCILSNQNYLNHVDETTHELQENTFIS